VEWSVHYSKTIALPSADFKNIIAFVINYSMSDLISSLSIPTRLWGSFPIAGMSDKIS
jgi:hypothetical protein